MSQIKQTRLIGLPPTQIKAMIAIRGETVDSVAKALRENPDAISHTINRNRTNQRIRLKLSKYFNISLEKLWGTNGDETITSVSTPAR